MDVVWDQENTLNWFWSTLFSQNSINVVDFRSYALVDTVIFRQFREGFIFAKLRMRSFAKIKPSQNGEITLHVTGVDKQGFSRYF